MEKEHLGILQNFLENSRFYYALDFDITVRAQIQSQFTEEQWSQPLWKRVKFMYHFSLHM